MADIPTPELSEFLLYRPFSLEEIAEYFETHQKVNIEHHGKAD